MQHGPARVYSERLGSLSDAQLQAALDHFGLGKLLHAGPAPTGLFGQNVFLVSTKGDYVLRGAGSLQQFHKEQFFTRMIHERTEVPAPWPYEIDASSTIFGWPYAVMPRLPGLDDGSPDVRREFTALNKSRLAYAMGENLARLQSLTWACCGEYDPRAATIAPIESSFADWSIAGVRWWLDRCRAASSATTDADLVWAEDLIAGARGALYEPDPPVFVHTDYKENNTVAERVAKGWRVLGVFDVGEAFFGDGEADLSRSIAAYVREDMELAREFLSGYRSARELRPGFTQRFALYMLRDRLIIWEFGQRNKIWFDEGLTLREWAEPYTSLRLLDPAGEGGKHDD